MKSSLKIYTSYVGEVNLRNIKDSGYLPIFAIRHINGSSIIGNYSNSLLHFKMLSPSSELQKSYNSGKITFEEFEKKYVIEMSKVNFMDLVKRLEYLVEHNNSKGIVILTLDRYPEDCYRKALTMIFNNSSLFTKPLTEFKK